MCECAGITVNSSNNNGGIFLSRSCNNSITGNTFVNDGLSVDDSYQNIVDGNIVNGKPLVYLEVLLIMSQIGLKNEKQWPPGAIGDTRQ